MRKISNSPLSRAAIAAASVALAALAAGCGQPRASSSPAMTGTDLAANGNAAAGHHTAAGRLGVEALDWYFPASGATYTTGLAFAWTQDKISATDTDPCLAAAGFPQPPFHGSLQQYQLSFPSSQFPDIHQLATHPGDHIFTGQYPVVRHPTTKRMNAFDRAQARCTARHARPVTRVDTAASTLQSTWYTIIKGIELSRPVRATRHGFTACLEHHGVPASLASTPDTPGNPLFAGYYAWADTVNQAATSRAALAADQRHENLVLAACARPVAHVLQAIQLPRRTSFFHQHATQITRITHLAQHMN